MIQMKQLIGVCCLSAILVLGHIAFAANIESQLRVGKAVNIFVRYGYLGISMRVISYNDTEMWLFKEPTNNIFKVRYDI